MPEQSAKPVIFLAFANDRMADGQYLRNLGNEADSLRGALASITTGPDAKWELVERPSATAKQIVDVFRLYGDRIAVFHYAGHADDYRLLLETAQGDTFAAEARDLAAVLSLQYALHLVFLNACSTRAQVDGLRNAGVKVVVATSRAVDDMLAATFAVQFYQALAAGKGIGDAYAAAQANTKIVTGDLTRHLRPTDSAADHATGEWPWAVYGDADDLTAASWTLALVANDPLFGLPPLPRLDLPETPYRHLEWFRREDAEIFFGRGHEIAELYRRVTAPDGDPIILFYGQSGVGKSSVLAAGLLPRLEQKHRVAYQRRDQTKGLAGTLAAALAAADATNLDEAWREAEARDGIPLTVLLDQVEELFTRPNPDLPDEVSTFLAAAESLFADPGRRPQGRLILSFRKEWLAEIETRLKERGLPRAKVFLKGLSREGIVEAIAGPVRVPRLRNRYGLSVADELPGLIADDLLADPGSPVAPMLQILLTGLWATAKDRDQPCFDQSLYATLRAQGLGLDDFLTRKLAELHDKQAQVVELGLALDLLAYHTTPLGTAEQRTLAEVEQTYDHQAGVLPGLVQECRNLYLLVDPSANQPDQPLASRLAHDTLAPHVRKRFDESDAPGQRARRILENRAVEWLKDRNGAALDDADLSVVEVGRAGMRVWKDAERRLVNASQVARAKRKQRQRFWRGTGLLAVLLVALSAAGAVWQWRISEKRLSETQSMALAAYARQAQSNGNSDLAVAAAYKANTLTAPPQQAQSTLAQVAYYTAGTRRLFIGHDDAVTSVAFGRDGKTAISGSADKSVILWDIESVENQFIRRFEGHGASVTSVAYDPTDPKRFASGSKDGTAILWNMKTGQTRIFHHSEGVNSVAFHPSGNLMLAGVNDGTVVLWDLIAGQARWQHKSEREINCVTFTPDGSRAVAGTHHGGPDADTIYVWDVDTGEQIHKIEKTSDGKDASNYGVTSLAVSPDNRLLLSGAGGYGPPLYLWDIDSGRSIRTLAGHNGGDIRVAFDPVNLQYAATGSYDDQIILWDIQNGRDIQHFVGHTGRITGLAFSPDGQHILSGSTDRTLRLWDIASGAESSRYQGAWSPVSSIACSASGVVAASYMNSDGSVYVWRDPDHYLREFHSGRRATDIDISPDGLMILAGLASPDNNLVLWNLDENVERHRLTQDGWITAVTFSPTDAAVALVSSYGNSNQPGFPRGTTLALWNVGTGERILDLSFHRHIVQDVVFSPDGHRALSGSADKTAIVWNLDNGLPVHTLTGHDETVTTVAFVPPDGSKAITGSADKTAILWDIRQGVALHRLAGHKSRIVTVAVSRDGRRALSGSEDGDIIVWDLVTHTEIARIVGHSGAVNKLVFCGDGHSVLSAGSDTTVRLWDVETPENLKAWTTENRYVRELLPEERHMVGIESRQE